MDTVTLNIIVQNNSLAISCDRRKSTTISSMNYEKVILDSQEGLIQDDVTELLV